MSLRVKNCCFCVPLRNGLLIWGYFSLVTIYLSALSRLYRLQNVFYTETSFQANEFFFLFISVVILLLYFIFHVVLVAGLHKKSSCMLDVYNASLIISMVLEGIAAGLYIPLAMFRLYENTMQHYDDHWILWIILFSSAVAAALDIFWKYYILVCVRSLVSTLGGDEEEYHSEYSIENPDVIVHDNIRKRKKDINLHPTGNSDVHDNTNKEKGENTQPVQNSDVTVHDGINTNIKNDNSQPAGNSDVIVYDKTQNRNSNEDKEMVTANQYHNIVSPGTSTQ